MRRLKLRLPSCRLPSGRAHEGFHVPADWVWATISVRIPMKADTCSDSYRTLIRRYRTVVGAKRRSWGSGDSTHCALARAGERRRRGFKPLLASLPVATRNGLPRPVPIGAPTTCRLVSPKEAFGPGACAWNPLKFEPAAGSAAGSVPPIYTKGDTYAYLCGGVLVRAHGPWTRSLPRGGGTVVIENVRFFERSGGAAANPLLKP